MRTILIEGAKELGLSMSDSAVDAFGLYFRLLEERNSVMNLTAISGAQETARLHFLDCLALLSLKGVEFPGKSLIDVGSGAGFPGLPMKDRRTKPPAHVAGCPAEARRFPSGGVRRALSAGCGLYARPG